MNYSYTNDSAFAQEQDAIDFFNSYRSRFLFPQYEGKDAVYFCGNSLGLQPQSTAYLMQQELKDWATFGVEGHFRANNPWMHYHHLFSESLSKIVGAQKEEVVACNTLTVNLHLLLISFYNPTATRFKIIMEAGAFPSDQYAIETQVKMHHFDPQDAIIELHPRAGEHTLRHEDIIATIHATGNELALVLLGGVNYYTGQLFDMQSITAAAHQVGALAGYDLAHAVGNVPLALHDWKVDFACWCSYKYLNSGPGGVGGIFVHEKHGNNPATFRLAGWWGNDEQTRFKMQKGFVPQRGAASWQMSNAPVFNMVAHRAALDIYDKTSVDLLRKKSLHLTGYMEYLLNLCTHLPFEIITPKNNEERGCQLSLLFKSEGKQLFEYLEKNGVIADWREPNVIRIAPVPLYNSYEDCFRFYELLMQYKVASTN